MKMGNYILVDKKPVEAELLEWAKWFEQKDVRRVAFDRLNNDSITVSTVFLGIDHNWGDDGPPVLFETMIFGGRMGVHYDEYQERYCTWEEAEQGHINAIKIIFEDAFANDEWELCEEIKNKYPQIVV